MRILITGFVAFVIWCVFSAWIYNDKLLPVLSKPVPVLTIPDNQTREADSLMKLKAMMPENLTIYFEFDDARFKPDPQNDSRIAEFRAWLDKYPGSKVLVQGFTDLVGTPEFNTDLGLKRAEAAALYLEEKGIPAGSIIRESLGESRAYESYITKEGRAKNRKTEISIKLP
ncbi:MAG: OmpA family protein [Bacteroidales bacterium]|jgi:outer membrane protein OmpA-like peptidoglycan-associated protein|nr:OmpA family protein [Bacteroidales bacterium]